MQALWSVSCGGGWLVHSTLVAALVLSFLFTSAVVTRAADYGVAGSQNFSVLAPPGDFLAHRVLDAAEAYRRQIAEQWLGRLLPEGEGFAIISVELSSEKAEARTLLAGPDRRFPGVTRVWLTVPPDEATGYVLAHEMCHVVLDAAYPNALPSWVHEGVASRYDDSGRIAQRDAIVASFAKSKRWPSLRELLGRSVISKTEAQLYAAACSLVDFLLTQGDPPTVLRFAADGRKRGWDSAVRRFYGMPSVDALQRAWETWVATQQKARR